MAKDTNDEINPMDEISPDSSSDTSQDHQEVGNEVYEDREITLEMKKEDLISNKLVVEGLKKAQILIAYGAQNGFLLESQDLEVFTHFKQAVLAGKWTTHDESKFWSAYANLARTLGNIKAKEIEAITISDVPKTWLERLLKIKSSPAQRIANIYTLAALGFVIVMLIIQVYALIGNNILNTIKDIQKSIVENQKSRAELWTSITQNGGRVHFMFEDIIESEKKDTVKNNIILNEAKLKLKDIKYQLWIDNMKLITTIFSLDKWAIGNRSAEIDTMKKDYYAKDSVELKYSFYKETLYMNPEESFVQHQDVIENVITSAKSPLDVMNLYLLPLLYGLIGAFAFVLRSLTSQLERIDYSSDSNIQFLLRLFLGAIVGLTVRMFIDTNDTSGLAMYSPLVLSFISGYSVEFFFSMIDNLIKRILGSDPQGSKSDS